MDTIKYNDKEIKMGIFSQLDLGADPLKMEEVKNPYSQQSCTLPLFAVAVYDMVRGAEAVGDYGLVRKGIDWFKQHFAKQYMVVLD